VAGFQFREGFLLLQLKCDLLVSGQDRAYPFRGARNREDVAQRLQRFMHWEVSEIVKMLHNVYKGSCIGKYPLRKSFTVDLQCWL
jgi:hypothetical protein